MMMMRERDRERETEKQRDSEAQTQIHTNIKTGKYPECLSVTFRGPWRGITHAAPQHTQIPITRQHTKHITPVCNVSAARNMLSLHRTVRTRGRSPGRDHSGVAAHDLAAGRSIRLYQERGVSQSAATRAVTAGKHTMCVEGGRPRGGNGQQPGAAFISTVQNGVHTATYAGQNSRWPHMRNAGTKTASANAPRRT